MASRDATLGVYLLRHNQIANCKQPEALAVAVAVALAVAPAVAADWRALATCAWLHSRQTS